MHTSRIQLKGMFGRKSWCDYFRLVQVRCELPGQVCVDSDMVLGAATVWLVWLTTLLVDPRAATV